MHVESRSEVQRPCHVNPRQPPLLTVRSKMNLTGGSVGRWLRMCGARATNESAFLVYSIDAICGRVQRPCVRWADPRPTRVRIRVGSAGPG
jgi:hypothetical protein